jgi:hypothetical protein
VYHLTEMVRAARMGRAGEVIARPDDFAAPFVADTRATNAL